MKQFIDRQRPTSNRLFNLETTQVQQQDNLAVAQGNIALNLINVYRALGGGWEIRCTGSAPAAVDAPSPHPEVLPAPAEPAVPLPKPNAACGRERPFAAPGGSTGPGRTGSSRPEAERACGGGPAATGRRAGRVSIA